MDQIDTLNHLIKLNSNLYRCTQAYLDKKLAKLGLSTGTYPYLFILNKMSGISQNDISRELNVDKAMSARTIKKLIEQGYIRKEENKDDIRAYQLYLTDQGKDIVPEILEIVNEWINIIVPKDMYDNPLLIEYGISFLQQLLENGKNYRANYIEPIEGDNKS